MNKHEVCHVNLHQTLISAVKQDQSLDHSDPVLKHAADVWNSVQKHNSV